MSDADTREAVREELFENCPLRTVLTKKPCPYFGASVTCRDCTYDWMSVAQAVRKVVESRRASYEKEHSKVKELKEELKAERSKRAQLEDVVSSIGNGLQAFKIAVDLTQLMKEESSKEADKSEKSGKSGKTERTEKIEGIEKTEDAEAPGEPEGVDEEGMEEDNVERS